ncbi:helix-turn-helix transcriptional regulator [Microvirga sp. BT688]|uniref:AraC family transcriptional regulator n=1 Tax=Microvirga sp. TaxID=1873136 RepID=UPI00168666C9|nr:AraC family transcriptional regulator [Microvirga sp.]MBD2750581.1 helix-turn-helix transcriptional regulator [Microvirga sp.]
MPVRFRQSGLTVSRARRGRPDLGSTLPNARRDFWLASLTLIGADSYNAWCDDRHVRAAAKPPGGLMIVDQRQAWIADIRQPIDSLHVFVPLASLHELTDEAHAPRIETLVCPIEAPQLDEVMLHLTRAILPALSRPHEASPLFVDYILRAMLVHLAQTYGGVSLTLDVPRGGLMRWQERRAKDMLLGNLQGNLSLSDLAAACGLSVRHFSRAFKATTGEPPHRWLLRQRVEYAKGRLASTNDTLGAIALACGFSDQSHLSRVFRAFTGTTPGDWRRHRRG